MSHLGKCLAATALAALLLANCSDDNAAQSSSTTVVDPSATTSLPTSDGETGPTLFGQGCPVAEQSLARQLTDESGPMDGPRVVGGSGDYLVANDAAAFVITAPITEDLPQRTWYPYGGIVVDAAAVAGCEQVAPDRVDEIGLVVGTLNINDFPASILRAFRADTVEVVNDGTDGDAAVVRATGSDDFLHLIEYQLIREAGAGGEVKPLSEPLGVGVEVDYILEPGDAALQISMRITAETAGARSLLGSALVTWGDDVEPINRSESVLEIDGFGLGLGIPWQIAQGDGGSYAFAVSDANQAIASISGVQAFINVNQAFDAPLMVDEVGDTAEMSFLLAVSATDANTATQALIDHDSELGPGPAILRPIAGTTVDSDGEPVGDARIEMQMRRDEGEWETYDVAASSASGAFETAAVVLQDGEGADPELRLRFLAPGRSPVFVEVPTGDQPANPPVVTDQVTLGSVGAIDATITDEAGTDLPARLTFSQEGEIVETIDIATRGMQPLAPGTYDVVVSRGYEYDRVETSVVVPDNGSAPLAAELTRVVDTSGWIAIDTHVHSSPSTDSRISPERRYLDAAVNGVEVVVNTNHEVIEDLGPALDSSGLSPWVAAITGQEVTASSPEHTTMYPVDPDGSVRGGNPLWYGLDLGEIYALEQERGAAIRGLNHPGGYLDLIEWDVVTATPGVTDASILGLAPGAALWSWDFEQVELQNGTQPVLGSDADDEGLFDFWQSAFNHGRRITAVAASDAHGIDLGDVMTYVRVPDDNPGVVTADQVATAIAEGHAVLSTGAFVEIEIDGAGPGDLASIDSDSAEVSLRIQAAPGIDVSSIQVFSNCDLVADIAVGPGDGVLRFDDVIEVDVPADTNITVLGFGSEPLPIPFHDANPARVPRFTTNPVFVDVDGNGEFDAPGDKSCSYPRS